MDRYKRIIREEINRLILSETLDVSPLNNYIQPLKKCASNIANIGNTNNRDVDAFINNMNTYVLQIIFGIQRCVQANSLNESLRDYGVDFPAELGGNFLRDFESEFYKGANWANRQLAKRSDKNSRNGNTEVTNNTNVNNVNNPNNVPSVRLEESLRKLAQMSLDYQNITNRHSNIMSQYNAIFFDTLNIISRLNTEYNRIKNTQGTNP